MATTTNYGWTTPDDTALVKDGASAIRALGTAIDTSMNTALGTKKSGLVLLNTTSFSGVSSQSVNNVFSATYDNYRVVLNIDSVSSTGTNVFSLRFGTSGTPNTNNNYSLKGIYVDSPTFTGLDQNSGGSTYITTSPSASTNEFVAQFDVSNPFATKYTFYTGIGTGSRGYANFRHNSYSGTFAATTSFTDIIIIPTANNMTGSVSIYGYNK